MTSLTRALQEQIVAAIRAGAFPDVAAQAFGVSRRLFRHWRQRGRSDDSAEPYRSFKQAVDAAIGQARLRAEMSVFEEQPRIWLQHGPGRETRERRGWTTAVKPQAGSRSSANALMNVEIQRLFQAIVSALDDEPSARAKVVRVAETFDFRGIS